MHFGLLLNDGLCELHQHELGLGLGPQVFEVLELQQQPRLRVGRELPLHPPVLFHVDRHHLHPHRRLLLLLHRGFHLLLRPEEEDAGPHRTHLAPAHRRHPHPVLTGGSPGPQSTE
jgi:hypothetical protein